MFFFAIYSHGHNILELDNILIQTRLTTSKTKRDFQCSKLGIRVALRVAERLKTQENLKLGWKHSTTPTLPPLKLNLGSSSQKTRKSTYQTFLVLSSFTGFLYSVPTILPRIVALDAFYKCLVYYILNILSSSHISASLFISVV